MNSDRTLFSHVERGQILNDGSNVLATLARVDFRGVFCRIRIDPERFQLGQGRVGLGYLHCN